MRTTLKKGTRGSVNGNGSVDGPEPQYLLEPAAPPEPPLRVAAPPVLPPGPSPRSSYRVRRNPLKVLAKFVVWLIVLVLVAAGALAGGAKLYFDYSVAAVRAHSPEVVAAAKDLDAAPAAGQPATAIVIGYDQRAGESGTGSRSDTVMLLRADPKKDTVTLLSFPRDLIVRHPRLRGPPGLDGEDQRGLRLLRPARHALDGEGADRGPDQLHDHGQLQGVHRASWTSSTASTSTSTAATSTTTRAPATAGPTPRSTSGPATRSSTAGARSTSSASGTRTPTSTASSASRSS